MASTTKGFTKDPNGGKKNKKLNEDIANHDID
jgi:hypothetical protein